LRAAWKTPAGDALATRQDPVARARGRTSAVERAADELYGVALPEFTKARDEHARRLRKEGLRDEAEAVKALRKPTIAAWALNQLARRRPEEVRRLLATGKRLREAQEALLAGGDRDALKRAAAEERDLVSELTRDATALAGEAGRAGTGSVDERIRGTLHAAVLDEQTAAELAAGRLVRDREAAGLFGAVPVEARRTGTAPRPVSRPERRRRDRAEAAKPVDERREAERALRAARAEAQRAEREHAAAAKAAERARARAEEAQRRADEALSRAGEARAALRDAERRERNGAKAHERARRAVASAEKKVR
jgi:hypothetical protein